MTIAVDLGRKATKTNKQTSRTFMKIGNQMRNHEKEIKSELIYEDGSICWTLIFYQIYRQWYTVAPVNTVRGTCCTYINKVR